MIKLIVYAIIFIVASIIFCVHKVNQRAEIIKKLNPNLDLKIIKVYYPFGEFMEILDV